jgi:hypothetical protein
MSKYSFFLIAFSVSFCWYWFPDFIFPALGYFTFFCWAAPKNAVVNQIFGMKSGLGLLPVTFDCRSCDCRGHLLWLNGDHRVADRVYRLAIGLPYLGYRECTCRFGLLDLHHLARSVLQQRVELILSTHPKQLSVR